MTLDDPIFEDIADICTEEFTLTELENTLDNTANGKTPGTDGIPNEFLKWLNIEDSKKIILQILNDMWILEVIPTECEIARIVSIYKKGNPELPENYRPIALLQSIYKIYASMIQNRLATALDNRVWKTQYGFRRNKSTSQPIAIVRRIQDYMEASRDPIILLFLDWEKAFDNVDHTELLKAIFRFNVPDKINRIIATFYNNPRFLIQDQLGDSSIRKQKTGIRQGCPLSPYLFVLLMTILFHDVHTRIDPLLENKNYDFINIWELLYADDTLLIGKYDNEIELLLHEIEIESAKYNMVLNKTKCEIVAMYCKPKVHFISGGLVKIVTKAKYLGSMISDTASRDIEINFRLAFARTTASKLRVFLAKSRCTYCLENTSFQCCCYLATFICF